MSSIFYLLFWAGGCLYCWLDAGLDLKLSCILLSKSLFRLPEDGAFSEGAFTRAEGDGSLMGNLSFASAGVSYCLNWALLILGGFSLKWSSNFRFSAGVSSSRMIYKGSILLLRGIGRPSTLDLTMPTSLSRSLPPSKAFWSKTWAAGTTYSLPCFNFPLFAKKGGSGCFFSSCFSGAMYGLNCTSGLEPFWSSILSLFSE